MAYDLTQNVMTVSVTIGTGKGDDADVQMNSFLFFSSHKEEENFLVYEYRMVAERFSLAQRVYHV